MKPGHSSRSHPPLEKAPGRNDNWVESSGGLPSYIKRIAKHIRSDTPGMTTSRAVASAISQVKRWARGGGDVTPATRAKAAAAVAQWEALKARNRARTVRRDLAVPTSVVVPSQQTTTGGTAVTTTPTQASHDGPRSTLRVGPGRMWDATPTTSGPRTHADLRRAITAAGPTPDEVTRRRLIRRARQINAVALVPARWLNLATPPGMVVVDLGWKHGFHPTDPATAMRYRKGYWVTPSGKRITAAQTRAVLGAKSNKDALRKIKKNPKAFEDYEKGVTRSSMPSRPGRTPAARKRTAATTSSSGRAADPTTRQTLRPSSTPTRGLTPDQRDQVAADAAATRAANTPRTADAVAPDMGRQRLDRGAAANAGPVSSRPVRNRPRRTQDAGGTGWVPVSEESNRRSREAFNASLRGTPVKGGEASANNPFEVTKRNDGKFYLNNTETKRRLLGPTTKKAAMAERAKRARTSPGQAKEAPEGHTIRRSPNGREWQVYDPEGNRVPHHKPLKTQAEARQKVTDMMATRRLVAADGAGNNRNARTAPSVQAAEGNPRFRTQQTTNGFRVLDTQTGRSTQTVPTKEQADRKMVADNLTAARAGRGGNDRRTSTQPPSAGALFGLTPEQRQEQKTRTKALPKGWTDSNAGLTPAAKAVRGNEITRRHEDVDMTIRAKADGSGYTWSLRQDGDPDPHTGEAPDLGQALKDAGDSAYEYTDVKVPGQAAAVKAAAGVKPPKVDDVLRAAGHTPPAKRRPAARKSPTRKRKSAPKKTTAPATAAPKRTAPAAAAAPDKPNDPADAMVTRRPTMADFEVRDLVDQETKDKAEANRNRNVPQPSMQAVGAANNRADRAQRHQYIANVASPGSYSDEQKLAATREALAAARAAEQARKKYMEQAAMDPAPDQSYKTPRSANTAARKRFERDGRTVYMVEDGAGVKLTGAPPRSGPYAAYSGSQDWGVHSGRAGNSNPYKRSTSPNLGDVRAQKNPDRKFTSNHEAQAEAQRRGDADGRTSYMIEDGDGVRVSDTRPTDPKTPFADYVPNREGKKFRNFPIGHGSPAGGTLTSMPNVKRTVARETSSPPRAARPDRAQTPVGEARRRFPQVEYGLNREFFGDSEPGGRAWDALVDGRNEEALRILRSGGQESLADKVERKLRRPNRIGAVLQPVGRAKENRDGSITRKTVDQTGREWDITMHPQKGTIRARSGRLEGETTFEPFDPNAPRTRSNTEGAEAAQRASQNAARLVGEMLGTGGQPNLDRTAGRRRDTAAWNRNNEIEREWSSRQAEYRRLRELDATGQSDDARAAAVVDAQTRVRTTSGRAHGVGVIKGSEGTNAKGRPTIDMLDEAGREWKVEYDPATRVFWVDGPDGRTGSARVNQHTNFDTGDVSRLVNDLLEGKRRNVRNVTR